MKDTHIRRAIMVERFKQYLVKRFNLKDVDKFLQNHVFNTDISQLSIPKLNKLLDKVQSEVSALYGVYVDDLKSHWQSFFDDSYRFETKSVGHIYTHLKDKLKPLEQNFISQAVNHVLNKPLDFKGLTGITLGEMLESFQQSESLRIVRTIRLAHHQGKTITDIIRLIRGTKARQYQDGVLSILQRNAESIARTGTAIFNTEAKTTFMEKHDDLIDGIQVIATLDSRTSPICRHLDREYMSLDKAIYPPFHFNCRSTFVYVLKGEKPSTDGMSYYEWLKTQSDDFQNQVLGTKRAMLFRDGGLSIEQFKALQLDKKFQPITLEEMKKLEPLVFAKLFDN
ncbi:minor capsid protein [Moraxella sp. ZY210820]|uniref:minor capsid protein n=1 Tax=Moraxella sp. ZY210820 TaxID=2904123 RepID=UPI0027300F8A|nr:minor capsid protein [Moraxella sp. ZY210820]WLF84829.1 minor capsid protein [Moraxella sp. ZY210820]